MFVSDSSLETISKYQILLCDGTFKCYPRPFYQLYVIFVIYIGVPILLVFTFLDGKSARHYWIMFKTLKKLWNALILDITIIENF